MAHNFPDEIIHDILFRLPPKSLIRCNSVCKPWNSMIKIPSFIRIHLSRTIDLNNQFDTHLLLLYRVRRDILYSDSNHIWDEDPMERYCYLRYDNLAFDEYCKLEFPIAPKEELYNTDLQVFGVCYGLVLLADYKYHLGFMLCNPSMRKSAILPKPHLNFKTEYGYIGFGFDAVTNDYKVLRLIRAHQCKDLNNFYEVYLLAGGSWSDPCSLVNGAIHWNAFCNLADGGSKCFILEFDVGSDSFHRIMVPKNFRRSCTEQLSISGFGKAFALSKHCITNTEEPYLEIWVMKEYGIEESWTKLTTLCQPGPQRGVSYGPLCFRKNGDLVLVAIFCCLDDVDDDRYELVCLDLVSKQCTNLGIRGYVYYYAESYVESLVLLDNTNAVSY